jgi:4-aminobutyrate aminotransferase-like enzyme
MMQSQLVVPAKRFWRIVVPKVSKTPSKSPKSLLRRQAIIAFEGGYHGRTLLTLSLTSKTAFKKNLGHLYRSLSCAIPV